MQIQCRIMTYIIRETLMSEFFKTEFVVEIPVLVVFLSASALYIVSRKC